MLTTTNQNNTTPSITSITPEQACRQAERCGRAALRGRPNPDPAVIDVDLAGAIALEHMWRLGGELYAPGQIAAIAHMMTRTAIRDLCDHGPSGMTGMSGAAMRRRYAQATIAKLRAKHGCEPTPELVIATLNMTSRPQLGRVTKADLTSQPSAVPLPPLLPDDRRDFTEMICDQDEAQRMLDEIAAGLSPLAQQALALGLEWGGDRLPTPKEIERELGISRDAADRLLAQIRRVGRGIASNTPNYSGKEVTKCSRI